MYLADIRSQALPHFLRPVLKVEPTFAEIYGQFDVRAIKKEQPKCRPFFI